MKRKLFKKTTERVAVTKDVTARKVRKKMPVFNLLLTILVWLAVVTLFYSGRLLRPQKLVLGQQAPDTIVASIDFRAENLAATQAGKRAAADSVLPVFAIDLSAVENARQVLTTNQLAQLIPPGEQLDIQSVIFTALSNTLSHGIISASDAKTGFNGAAPAGKVALRGGKTDVIRTLDSFIQPPDALKPTVSAIIQNLPKESRNEEMVRALIAPWLWPNLVYDAAETTARRTQAMDTIEPVIEPVSAGTILVRTGDTVSDQTLRWLAAHEKRQSELETPAERIQRLAGSGLLLLIGLGLAVAATGIIRPQLLRSRRDVLLMLTISLLPLVIGKALLYIAVDLRLLPTAVLDFTMPLALAPILAAVLLGSFPGLIVGFWTSFALAALLSGNFNVFILGLMVTMTAVYTTRDVKRRTALFRTGLWAGAIKILFALVLAVLNQPSWPVLLSQLGGALLSGISCALLAALLIPLFEHLFKVTTDITLLELSDLSHPLLQSLAINAPGTYHHSLMMASLAQNAAEAIGANGLMLRVCAYFHDIGKLVKPGFFSENIQFSENPHDDLAPSMSTLVIVSHIKEGVTLAKKYKLPQVIIDGIQQHQGTTLVSVFYHRARTQQQKEGGGPASALNDEDFRYEGPRPQNREMAILMLADGCEAASRSLEKPTPGRIMNLINEIFDARLRDGQLEECNLTLAELGKIKQSFIFSLTNMLHGRIAYPKDENRTDKPAETPAESAGNPSADH